MSDIKELLDRTARSVEVTPPAETVEADLRRGRAALARRRRGRATRFCVAGTVAAAALVATTTVAGNLGGTDETTGLAPRIGVNQGSGPDRGTQVRLVAYDGEQLEGFIIDQVPEGWYLQGSNTFGLTVAPQGDTTSPDDFVGKLVVMLLSSSAPQELPNGEPVKVGEYDGVVTHPEAADILTYEDDTGHFVQIQAWRAALGWTNEQLASFAEGVQVSDLTGPAGGRLSPARGPPRVTPMSASTRSARATRRTKSSCSAGWSAPRSRRSACRGRPVSTSSSRWPCEGHQSRSRRTGHRCGRRGPGR
jgi:hypothetical protein